MYWSASVVTLGLRGRCPVGVCIGLGSTKCPVPMSRKPLGYLLNLKTVRWHPSRRVMTWIEKVSCSWVMRPARHQCARSWTGVAQDHSRYYACCDALSVSKVLHYRTPSSVSHGSRLKQTSMRVCMLQVTFGPVTSPGSTSSHPSNRARARFTPPPHPDDARLVIGFRVCWRGFRGFRAACACHRVQLV